MGFLDAFDTDGTISPWTYTSGPTGWAAVGTVTELWGSSDYTGASSRTNHGGSGQEAYGLQPWNILDGFDEATWIFTHSNALADLAPLMAAWDGNDDGTDEDLLLRFQGIDEDADTNVSGAGSEKLFVDLIKDMGTGGGGVPEPSTYGLIGGFIVKLLELSK